MMSSGLIVSATTITISSTVLPISRHSPVVTESTCLNCGAELHGAFCSRCGQRVIPPYPTMRELVGDAWHELSGYDGRFMRTFSQHLIFALHLHAVVFLAQTFRETANFTVHADQPRICSRVADHRGSPRIFSRVAG